MSKNNWYIKWPNTNRIRPECSTLIALHGWHAYGLYTAVREILSQHGGEVDIKIIQSQLNVTFEDLRPLVDNKCYFLLSGLLSDFEIKDESERQKSISESRSLAGRAAMEKRWKKPNGKPRPVKDAKKVSKPKKDLKNDPDLFQNGDENDGITSVTNSNSKRENDSKESFYSTQKPEIVTNVIKKALERYKTWFKQKNDMNPPDSAAGNKALRKIIGYLLQQIHLSGKHPVEDYEKQTFESWKFILANHESWGKYEAGKVRLQDIDSNLSNIIANIKLAQNGKSHPGINGNGQSNQNIRGSSKSESLSSVDAVEL